MAKTGYVTETMTMVCQHYGVATMQDLPAEASVYPEFFPRGSLIWTYERLDTLTMDKRLAVCKELREIYLKKGAKAYGEYLNEYVRSNGSKMNALSVKSANHPQVTELSQEIQQRIAAIRATRSSTGSKILDMAKR